MAEEIDKLRLPSGEKTRLRELKISSNLDRPEKIDEEIILKISWWCKAVFGTKRPISNLQEDLPDTLGFNVSFTVRVEKEAWLWIKIWHVSRSKRKIQIDGIIREPETDDQHERWPSTDERREAVEMKAKSLYDELLDTGPWWWPWSTEFYSVVN